MTTSKYIVLEKSRFLTIKGPDSKEFLQSIITNNINNCEKKTIYSCILSPQGKFLADFFITFYHNAYLVEIHEKFIDDLISKLNLYKLRSDVFIECTENYTSIAITNNSSEIFNADNLIKEKEYLEYTDPRNQNLGKNAFKIRLQ